MMLWLRVRRLRACLVAVFFIPIAANVIGMWFLPMPSITGGSFIAVPLALLVPLVLAIVLAFALSSGDWVSEAVASRPLRLYDLAFVTSAALLTIALCLLGWWLGGNALSLAAGRNAVGYVGLTLIGQYLLGRHAASLLAVGMVILTTLFGLHVNHQPRWWAWPLAGIERPEAWICAAVLFVLGVFLGLQYRFETVGT